jgi:hypothetical protein
MRTVESARPNDFATVSQAQDSPLTARPELTIVIPTLYERDNIGPLVDLLDAVLDTVRDAMGRAARERHHRRCNRTDGVPHATAE